MTGCSCLGTADDRNEPGPSCSGSACVQIVRIRYGLILVSERTLRKSVVLRIVEPQRVAVYHLARYDRIDFAYELRKTWCLCDGMHTAFCINGTVMHGRDRKNCIKKEPPERTPERPNRGKERRDPDVAGIGYERPGGSPGCRCQSGSGRVSVSSSTTIL